MTARKKSGYFLIEALVYIAIFALVMSIMGKAFRSAFEVVAAASSASGAVQDAEAALGALRQDIKRAQGAVLPPAGRADGVLLALSFPDRTCVAYALRGERLTRWTWRGEPSVTLPDPVRRTNEFPGCFLDASVQTVPGAKRVFRIDLALRLDGPGSRKKPLSARFSTAVAMRVEDAE